MSALTESDSLMNSNWYLIRMSALTESDTVNEFELVFNTNCLALTESDS